MIFHSIAFPFNDDSLGMVEESIKKGGGEHAVVIEDFRPVFVSPVGGDDNRPPFVALAEHLKKKVAAELVNGQISQFIKLCGAPHKLTYVECSFMLRTIYETKQTEG